MFIADTHSDTLFAMGVMNVPKDQLHITPERLREGGVTLQTFALWTGGKGNQGDYKGIVAKELSQVQPLINAGLKQVDAPRDAKEGENAFMLSIEGCEVFEDGIHTISEYRAKGVRMAAIVWNNENRLGHPAKSGSTEGLTEYGIQCAKEMQRLHMACDTSHLNEAGFWDLFAKTDAAPLASHSCCRHLCDHFRNLTDAQIKEMIRGGGYIGINFYPAFLAKDGEVDCKTVVDHIDHVCQLGGEGIVGFGSDFDGIEIRPKDLNGPHDLPRLIDEMKKRGYSDAAIRGIAGENLLKYFDRI